MSCRIQSNSINLSKMTTEASLKLGLCQNMGCRQDAVTVFFFTEEKILWPLMQRTNNCLETDRNICKRNSVQIRLMVFLCHLPLSLTVDNEIIQQMLYCFKPSELQCYTMYLQHFNITGIISIVLHGTVHIHMPTSQTEVSQVYLPTAL